MLRRLAWRVYDLFFDRGVTEFYIDPARLDWIREHEPDKLRPVPAATRRNARRVLQIGLLLMVYSLWRIVRALWISNDSDASFWFSSGLLLGTAFMAAAASRLLAYLAYLRGDSSDRPRSAAGEAPAR